MSETPPATLLRQAAARIRQLAVVDEVLANVENAAELYEPLAKLMEAIAAAELDRQNAMKIGLQRFPTTGIRPALDFARAVLAQSAPTEEKPRA